MTETRLESYIKSLLPIQQEVIARAALAGCRIEPVTVKVQGKRMWKPGKWRYGMCDELQYHAILPNGISLGLYRDLYEASLQCMTVLDMEPAAQVRFEAAQARFEELFKLLPSNKT